MSCGLRRARQASVILAAATLAAGGSAAAASDRALLGVSVLVEPSCAVSAPSRLQQLDAGRAGTADGRELLDVACTSGTSWTAIAEPQDDAASPEASGPKPAADVRAQADAERARPGEAEAPRVIRITVRY